MSSRRVIHALAVLGTIAGLGLTGATGASALVTVRESVVPRAVSPTPTPKPEPLPAARSWVGGKNLIENKVQLAVPAGVPAPPAPPAASWLIADLDTRQILAAHRAHVPLAPASTLKIFTGLALAHRLDPAKVYTGRDDDAAVDGTRAGIVPGSTYTVDDLLHGMLMSSGNDCANALGNLVGGRKTAVGLIQDEARQLGAFDTVARTTNGLDAKGQVSSAYDLALAGSAALADPQLSQVMTTTMYRFPGVGKSLGKKRARFQIQNHNRMLRNYDGATGVKNGYTVAAHGSFVGSATRKGHSYIAVVMRADGSTWHETTALLDWAFAHGGQAQPVGELVRPGELPSMTGPGLNDGTISAGRTPAPAPAGAGAGADLRGALPATSTSLSAPAAAGRNGRILLVGAAIALVLIAFVVGRRPRFGFAGSGRGRSRTRPGGRSRIAGNGKHRG